MYSLIIVYQFCLFVDEYISNTNMENMETKVEKIIIELVFYDTYKVAISDSNYNIMNFTEATGEPVMVNLIFTSESKNHPSTWMSGIDSRKFLIETLLGKSNENSQKIDKTTSYCLVPRLVHLEGRKCGGITSQILVQCLQKIGKLEILGRENGVLPFAIVDGHQSRFEVDFLSYIDN